MKPDDIRRSVRGSKLDRDAGDGPLLDHVGRMPGVGLPKRKRKRKKLRDSIRFRRRKRVASLWTCLIGLIALVLLGAAGWGWMYWQKIQREDAAIRLPEFQASSPEDLRPARPVKPEIPSLPENTAISLVREAIALRDAAKVQDYFRAGSSSFLEIVDFLKESGSRDGEVDHCEWLGNMDANDLQMDGVVVRFSKDGELSVRVALLVADPAGKWKIDFDAYARHVSPSWHDILGQQAGRAVVRVHSIRQNYYNGPFRDDSLWTCYGLASPDMDESLMGYCKKGSPQADAMAWVLSKDANSARVIVEIRRVEGGEARQFEITGVISEDWVMGEKRLDGRFE